jgi:hypothetical protein
MERQVSGLKLTEDRSDWDIGQVARMSPPAQIALQLFRTVLTPTAWGACFAIVSETFAPEHSVAESTPAPDHTLRLGAS